MTRRINKSNEEKVANRISELLSDIRVDLDQVGIFLARNGNLAYNRFMLIAEAAEFEKELENGRQQYTLF